MGYIEDLRTQIGHMPVNLCGSAVFIRNSEGKLLMQQRKYPYGKWGLPCGLMELGESAEDTARREVFEETSLTLGDLQLFGVYSGEKYFCRAANGDEFFTIVIAYLAESYSGDPTVHDDESLQFQWIDPSNLPSDIANSHKEMLAEYVRRYVQNK